MKKTDYIRAFLQINGLFWLVKLPLAIVGLFVVPVGLLFVQKGRPNKFGETSQCHKGKYIEKGASGHWDYWSLPGWLWLWSNDEDGLLGEPSGKHSARVGGKERSFWGMYQWAAIRNPVNNLRYTRLMSCRVEDCDIEWKGVGDSYNAEGALLLNDNDPLLEGWYFVRATHRETGRKYYNYRRVKRLKSGKILHIRCGFKVKPVHVGAVFDEDDKDKGFTYRITPWAEAN